LEVDTHTFKRKFQSLLLKIILPQAEMDETGDLVADTVEMVCGLIIMGIMGK
jgi:hypothetical protein